MKRVSNLAPAYKKPQQMFSEMKNEDTPLNKDDHNTSIGVPPAFCDSVVSLTDEYSAKQFQKLEGYWSEAGRKTSNHHIDCFLDIHPIAGDRWEYALGIYGEDTPIYDWKELLAEKRCLVIRNVTVTLEQHVDTTYECMSTPDLKELLYCGYKTPLDVFIAYPSDFFTPEQRIRIAKLLEEFNVSSINMDCAPEFHDFLVKLYNSPDLVGATVAGEIPNSLKSHIQEWARKDYIKKINVFDRNFNLDFSAFENLVKRIEKFGPGYYTSLNLDVHFSQKDCERILAVIEAGSEWRYIGQQQCFDGQRQWWENGTLKVFLDKDGGCEITLI